MSEQIDYCCIKGDKAGLCVTSHKMNWMAKYQFFYFSNWEVSEQIECCVAILKTNILRCCGISMQWLSDWLSVLACGIYPRKLFVLILYIYVYFLFNAAIESTIARHHGVRENGLEFDVNCCLIISERWCYVVQYVFNIMAQFGWNISTETYQKR